jgi:diacylglycerol O-acyltransferase / wax synthase
MADRRTRELRFERKMSDAEALMWNIEKDPWMNPSGGVVTILDRPVDIDLFRARIRKAVADIPRLRERVVSTTGRLTNPTWEADVEFDFDWHLRHVALAAPGSERQLFDLTALLLADPYDRTRPLWQFVVIDGLSGGRGALFWRFHHSIMDGRAALRLTESYMDLARVAPRAQHVDIAALIVEAAAQSAAQASPEEAHAEPGKTAETRSGSVAGAAGQVVEALRGPMGLARRVASEMLLLGADPARGPEAGAHAAHTLQTLREQLAAPGTSGSELWKKRSRHRHVEAMTMPLAEAKAAAKALGGSVNDLFIAGAVGGAVAYHEARGESLEYLTVSFVVNTRTDDAIGGNSFTPSIVKIPTTTSSPEERIRVLKDLIGRRRAEVGSGSGLLGNLATLAKLLPTSVVTGLARQQAGAIDFATSNMRGAPFDVYIAGAKLLRNVTLGPVAGSAFNLTCLSMGDHLDIGMHIDPVAVSAPGDLRACMESAFADLLAFGSVSAPTTRNTRRTNPKAARTAPKTEAVALTASKTSSRRR